MFGSIGTGELIVLLVVALIFLGPERLPSLARTLGRTLTEFRRTTNDIKRTLSAEMTDDSPYHPPPISEEMKRRIRERTASVSREDSGESMKLSPRSPTDESPDQGSAATSSSSADSSGLANNASAEAASPPLDEPPLEVEGTVRGRGSRQDESPSEGNRS